MPFTVIVQHGSYLGVRASGPALVADICGLIDLAAEVARPAGHTRALLDLQGVEIAFSFTDHLHVGSHAADRLRELERVASVVAPQFRTGTSEKAAQKLGLQLRTFTSLDEGMRWLES